MSWRIFVVFYQNLSNITIKIFQILKKLKFRSYGNFNRFVLFVRIFETEFHTSPFIPDHFHQNTIQNHCMAFMSIMKAMNFTHYTILLPFSQLVATLSSIPKVVATFSDSIQLGNYFSDGTVLFFITF